MDIHQMQSVLFFGYLYIWCNYYFLGTNAVVDSYNIALTKPTKQGPGTWQGHGSALAVDGDLGQDVNLGDCSHTQGNGTSTGSWWSVDFEGDYYLSSIRILRRSEVNRHFLSNRTAGCSIKGLPGNQEIYNEDHSGLLYNQLDISISVPLSLRNMRFSGINISIPGDFLTLCEVQVFLAQNCTVPILNNGIITRRDDLSASDVLPLGATVTYICNAGYTPYIQRELTCESNGLRDESNNPPRCSARLCGAIRHDPPVSNGEWQQSDANTDGICLYYQCDYTYRCKKGYIQNVANPITTTCDENGTWTNPEGTCTAIECLVQIKHEANYTVANLLDIYTYNTQLTAECLEGYELSSGNLNRTCLENGTWSGLEPMCTIGFCMLPDEDATLVTQLRPLGSAPDYGSFVESACIIGYKHVAGNLTRQCQADLTWSGTPPVCNVTPPLNNPECLSTGLTAVTGGFIGAGTVIFILLISAGTLVLLRCKRRNSNTASPYETTINSTPTPYSTIDESIRTKQVTGDSETTFASAVSRDTKCYEDITDKSKVYDNLQI